MDVRTLFAQLVGIVFLFGPLTLNAATSSKKSHFRSGQVKHPRHRIKHIHLPEKNMVFELIAQVQSPQFKGQTLQSTAVDLRQGVAAIGYNFAGETSAGGVEIYQWKKKQFTLLQSLYSEEFELAAIKFIDEHTLLGVGAARDLGAALFIFKHSKTKLELAAQLLLPGHYATSVSMGASNKTALVSTGDDGGSFVVDLKNLAIPLLVEDHGEDFILDGLYWGNSLLQLQSAGPTELIFLNPKKELMINTYLCSEKIEAPAQLIVTKGKLATNACPGFFKILTKNSRTSQFTELAKYPIVGKGNGLDAISDVGGHQSLFFLAQGDYGLKVVLYSHQQNWPKDLGQLETGDDGSSNAVFVRKTAEQYLLFIPSGKQGMRVYSLGAPKTPALH